MIPKVVSAASVLLLWLSSEAYAAPAESSTPAGLTIPLRMRSPPDSTELGLRAKAQRDAVIAKYDLSPNRKRSTGYNLIVDQLSDSSYYGSLAIGTPLMSFDIVLDTGSSDLWVVNNGCGSACKGMNTFNPSSSSSFKNLSTPFAIQYGSGSASGFLGQDIVEMAGFSVSNQGFGVVSTMSQNVITAPVSGVFGLAWQTLSSSGEMPFWQTLASSGKLDSALFAIQLRRYGNATNPSQLEPGGELTLGYTNSSLYTGSIDYIDIPGTPSFWYLTLTSLTVQGSSVSFGSETQVAIDTGSTAIGGPTDAIAAIYAKIPNSSPASGNFVGYYQFPCSTSVNVTVSFGSNTWTISPADFILTTGNSGQCIGAIYDLGSSGGNGAPSWIFGDTFLKNVYSVFRYNPPSIGFAALSEVALAENGVNGAAPSATIGSVAASVTNTSGAAPRVRFGLGRAALVGVVTLVAMVSWLL